MELHKKFVVKIVLCFISLCLNNVNGQSSDNTYATTQISLSECYDNYGLPRVSVFQYIEHNLEI